MILLKICFVDFLEGEEGERKRERDKNIDVRVKHRLPPGCTLTRERTCSFVMCPDWELNRRLFGARTKE